MNKAPVLLYLHGVGQGDLAQEWRHQLSQTLTDIGYPNLDNVEIIAPKYADAFAEFEEAEEVPPLTIPTLTKDAARQNRINFGHRTSAMEFRLGRHNGGAGGGMPDAVVSLSVELPWFYQARNYLTSEQVRAQVLNRILAELPEAGSVVIIGHSLGSVIAADLVRRLPPELSVAGLVTIGSPLANGNFNVDRVEKLLHQPPSNMRWWVNFWSGTDPVAAKRGVSGVIPWVLDYRIKTPLIPGTAHSSKQYCADPAVGEAIGFGLFGSRSKELVVSEKNLSLPLNEAELFVVQALRFSYLISQRLQGEKQQRFNLALRDTQARFVQEILAHNQAENRPNPVEIKHLEFDFADPEAAAPIPLPSPYVHKEEAARQFVDLVGLNLLHPFEIEVDDNIRFEAMKDFSEECQLGSQFGADVMLSLNKAEDLISTGRKARWLKWGALGFGTAALAAASGGLALAAAPGVAGAAAITSALVGFGPGGIAGGLLTAGTLISAGSSGIAVGVLKSSTTAEEVEALVAQKLAVVILNQIHQLDNDPETWNYFVDSERSLRRELTRLENISDDKSPTVAGVKRKLEAVEKALAYMSQQGLEPGLLNQVEAGPIKPKLKFLSR
ncbi:hypothetical protein SFC07_01980 [Corynebacterium callunae]|uniref:hypothetical protein n=1 Tax=Corynebacterium callunae TaxID=1721 RepID=UPI0039823EF8